MNRRSFLKWFGFGAAAVAVPAIAAPVKERGPVVGYEIWGNEKRALHASEVYEPPSLDDCPLLRGELGRYEGVVFHTQKVSIEEAREMFPADQWSGQEILRLQRMLAPPYVINRIATVEDRHLAGLITRS